ncbi:hypothetical protein ACQBAR_13465 [Propionibacteriaceae bacterium Y1685]|uniref:hypothetical protein n=1 Tax=Microlunatus sp. Y1700 TaxID=3418487 RepID=UPI003B80FA2D
MITSLSRAPLTRRSVLGLGGGLVATLVVAGCGDSGPGDTTTAQTRPMTGSPNSVTSPMWSTSALPPMN